MTLSRFLPPVVAGKAWLWKAFRDRLRGRSAPLARNARFHDAYRGKRCFVVGSGPSVRKLDLSKLRGEHVLTVNAFMKHVTRYGVVPLAHSLMDPWYFDGRDPEHKDLQFIAHEADPAIEFFLPLDYRAVVEKVIPAGRRDRINYLGFAGWYPENSNARLTSHLPRLQTVTLAPALIALWMGFSEIYLIGCDLDWLSNVVATNPLRIVHRNFYEETDSVIDVGDGFEYTTYVEAIAKMFRGFHHVKESAREGQRIFNASEGGMLDIFERVAFDGLFPAKVGG